MNKIVKLIYILVTVQFVIAMPKSVEKEQCDQLINDDSETSGLNLLYDSASSSEVQIIQNKKLKECLDFYMKNFFFLNESEQEESDSVDEESVNDLSKELFSNEAENVPNKRSKSTQGGRRKKPIIKNKIF